MLRASGGLGDGYMDRAFWPAVSRKLQIRASLPHRIGSDVVSGTLVCLDGLPGRDDRRMLLGCLVRPAGLALVPLISPDPS